MIRQWGGILLLVLVVLAQTACPRNAAQQNPDADVDNPRPTRERGGRGSELESAPSGRRVALVMGNSAYTTAPLKNPVYDARDMAQTLRDLGFDVLQQENSTQNEMKRAIRAFGEKIRQSSVALFYYAGHGIQVNGQNYLVPVGATIDKQEEVEYEGVDVGLVLAQMEAAGSQINIVVLDACRNNPFTRRFRSATRGLASMQAPSGTLIAYATAPGAVADDGNERNGVYTQEVLKQIRMPGLDVEEVFKRVRMAVRAQTHGQQTPWESSSLVGHFYFTNITVYTIPSDASVPAHAAASKLLFEEHFTNNSRQWLESSNDEIRFAVMEGTYVMEAKVAGKSWHATQPVAITQSENFKIECTARKIEGVDNAAYGLIWGRDDKNYYSESTPCVMKALPHKRLCDFPISPSGSKTYLKRYKTKTNLVSIGRP